jgi:hypothetical protein
MCFKEDIGRSLKILIVCFAQPELERIECIYFLNAISTGEFGLICKLIGLWLRTFKGLYPLPNLLSENLFYGSSWMENLFHS